MDTTSKMRGLHPNAEMSMIGYAIAIVIFIGMIPLLPFFLLYYVLDKLGGGGREHGY